MDLLNSMRSKSARMTSWKTIYDEYIHDIDQKPKGKGIDWYEKCMNLDVMTKILPNLKTREGTNLTFEVSKINDEYFRKNILNYLQMIVMATLYHVTSDSNIKTYVSIFDHDTDLVVKYPIDQLLMASFYGIKINGIVFISTLSELILKNGYEEPIKDPEVCKKIFSKIDDYSDVFGIPIDIDENDYSGKKKKNPKKLEKKIGEIPYYPCCRTNIQMTGEIKLKCTDLTLEDAHNCFGDCESESCGEDENEHNIHSQMFDFNKFMINIKKDSDESYTITFDQNQVPSYKHASYTSMGRTEVITSVKETLMTPTWVTSMKIKISQKNDRHVFKVKHLGVDWF